MTVPRRSEKSVGVNATSTGLGYSYQFLLLTLAFCLHGWPPLLSRYNFERPVRRVGKTRIKREKE